MNQVAGMTGLVQAPHLKLSSPCVAWILGDSQLFTMRVSPSATRASRLSHTRTHNVHALPILCHTALTLTFDDVDILGSVNDRLIILQHSLRGSFGGYPQSLYRWFCYIFFVSYERLSFQCWECQITTLPPRVLFGTQTKPLIWGLHGRVISSEKNQGIFLHGIAEIRSRCWKQK